MTIRDLELQLYKEDIIFTFSGAISYNVLSAISLSIKDELSNLESGGKQQFNVYYVLIELVQNIINYSVRRDQNSGNGYGTCFVIHHAKSEEFKVCSGNVVSNEQAQKIKNKIEKINSFDEVELKAYYKETRRSGRDMHDKGGGLGFIEIARKSKGKLNYRIEKIDSDKSYFEINVNI